MIAVVTGARGFIGTQLVREIARQGGFVGGVGHGSWPEHRNDGASCWINGEIDSVNLNSLAEQTGTPGVLFHLAGGSSVSPSFRAPLEDFRRTVDSTARVLEWVRNRAPDCLVVFVSTAAVYGASQRGPISEDAPVAPASPYGFHKAMGETLCASYAKNFGVRTSVVRLFSVYGPGLRKQLLWDLCARLRLGENPLILEGTGAEIRDWIHVRDAVRLLVFIANAAQTPLALNGGSGTGTTVTTVATRITQAWGALPPQFSGVIRPGDPVSLVANINRARDLGFEPVISLDEGLDETVAWFRNQRRELT